MKEDYLWDKTGEDPEIERLENALQAFRYTESAPPALPAKIIPFEKTPRKFFRLAFAFAACAAFVIVSLGVWLRVSSNKIQIAKNPAETTAPQNEKKISDNNSVKKQDNLITEIVEIPKQSAEQRKIVKTRKVIPAIHRQNNLTAQNVPIKKPVIKLTKEENYAYSQLMLALSITSSKLNLVKDKVNGVEKQNAVLENGR